VKVEGRQLETPDEEKARYLEIIYTLKKLRLGPAVTKSKGKTTLRVPRGRLNKMLKEKSLKESGIQKNDSVRWESRVPPPITNGITRIKNATAACA